MKENINILFIEDSLIYQKVFINFIKENSLPYNYQIIDNIKDVLNIVKENKDIDIIITDYLLKDGTAFEILENITQIPIIFITAHGSEEISAQALKKGAYEYLIKDDNGNYLKILPQAINNTLYQKETELLYNTLYNEAPFGVVLIDPQTQKAINYNERAYKQLGYNKEEFKELKISDYEVIEKPIEIKRHIDKIINEGRDDFFTKHKTKNNKIIDVMVTVQKVKVAGKTYFHSVFNDVTELTQIKEELKRSEEKFKTQYKNIPLSTFTWQKQSNDFILVDYNHQAEVFTNGKIHKLLNKKLNDIYKNNPQIINDITKCYNEKKIIKREMEYTLITTNETKFLLVHYAYVPPDFVMIHIDDITQKKQFENRLNLISKVFEVSIEAILITNKDATIIEVNKAFTNITGYSPDEAIGNNARILKSDKHNKEFYENFWKTLIETGNWEGEIWDRRKSGEIYPKWLSVSTVKDRNNETIFYIGIFTDITSLKKTEKKLSKLAYNDALTGIANRTLFFERLNHAIKQENKIIGLLFIDLDGFKAINDNYGHRIGDELLVEVSYRLNNCIRKMDTVARYGGDEFAIILEDIDNHNQAISIAKRIIKEISQIFIIQNKNVSVTASIGIAFFPIDTDNAENLLKKADISMYEAKKEGKNKFKIYSEITNK